VAERPTASAGPAGGHVDGPFGPDGHPRRWAILGVLVVSLLIVVLDNTVLNIALPTIQRDLNASQSQLVWSVDSYILVFAALLYTWGTLGDRFGRKKILLAGLALFAIGSALAAMSTSAPWLIAFRAVMGLGGAAIMPVTLAVITVIFPPRERGKAIGMWAGSVGAAVVLGPVLGGLLLENPQWFHWLIGNDWGSVFLINVPIVLVGAAGIVWLVPETKNPDPQHLDVVGLVLSVVGLTALVYGIIHAGDTKDWLAPTVLGPIVGGVAVICLFLFLEQRSEHKSFDVTLFHNRGFSVSLIASSLAFFAMSGMTFTLPFYLQVLRDYSTLVAGLCFLPFAIGQFIAAPNSSVLVDRFGVRAVISIGLVLVTLSMAGLAIIKIDTPLWLVLVDFFFFGLGMGAVIAPSSTVIQNSLPLARAGAGSAVQNTVRQVFGALGVAIVGTILATEYSGRLAPTLAGLPATFPDEAGRAVDSSVAAVPAVIRQAAGAPANVLDALRAGAFDAYLGAAHVTTWVTCGMTLVAALLVIAYLPKHIEVHGRVPRAEPTVVVEPEPAKD
jgi:EmrB/QacA subfamily drug resistance transporter